MIRLSDSISVSPSMVMRKGRTPRSTSVAVPGRISAPKDVKIIRNELRHAQETNLDSSQAVTKDALDALLTMKKEQ